MALVTINFSGFPGPGPTGVSFTAGGTVAAFLNANPTIPISLPATGITADNLTSLGLLSAGGDTVWRIANAGVADSVTLFKVGGGFSTSLSVPANSFTFLRGSSPGTYKLTTSSPADTFTKASGPQLVSSIATLAITDSYNITGSNFNDTLLGGQNADTLIGGLGNDSLNGQQQNDLVDGGAGNDTLIGGGQNDTLIGGAGNDTLTGVTGADRFQYNSPSEGIDTITDFTVAQGDVLAFAKDPFGGLPLGTLAANQLAAAENGVARFIYNAGLLQYDTNLAAPGGLVGIATLTGTPAITNTQIVIV